MTGILILDLLLTLIAFIFGIVGGALLILWIRRRHLQDDRDEDDWHMW